MVANILGFLSLYCRAPVPLLNKAVLLLLWEKRMVSGCGEGWEGAFSGTCEWIVLKVFQADYWRLKRPLLLMPWCCGKSTLEIPENICRLSFFLCLKTLWLVSWSGMLCEGREHWALLAHCHCLCFLSIDTGWKEMSLKWVWWKIGTAIANVLVSEALLWVSFRESELTALWYDSPWVGMHKKVYRCMLVAWFLILGKKGFEDSQEAKIHMMCLGLKW